MAAGSQQRLALVLVALLMAWMMAATLSAYVLMLLLVCVRMGVPEACPAIELAGLVGALIITLAVAGCATARRRRLLWGRKRAAFIVLACLVIIWLLFAAGWALTPVPSN